MRTVEWKDGQLQLIDQRQLPWKLSVICLIDYRDAIKAIADMVVRGAPAIGATGAFAMVLAARQFNPSILTAFRTYLSEAAKAIRSARPTAVNLAWAVERMLRVAEAQSFETVEAVQEALLAEAQALADQDVAINKRMAEFGATLINNGDTILHHCNTGALAAVDWGTALGVVRTAHEQGKHIHVLLDETRPRFQGARLSAWELTQYGVSFEVIADNAAGHFMQKGDVNIVLVGSDRTAANGDVANKIGTYNLAVIAKENKVPFYPVVPTSTIDLTLESGELIPIEERAASEIRAPFGQAIIPESYPVRNPAFDVTPHRYVTGIVTECGIVYPPFGVNLRRAITSTTKER